MSGSTYCYWDLLMYQYFILFLLNEIVSCIRCGKSSIFVTPKVIITVAFLKNFPN
jgi:hypothetical protein